MTHPYASLEPHVVLDALDGAGFRGDGRLLPLTSYENRVYQVWLEDNSSVVAKFYRPGRWSAAQIAEEHAFAKELAEREIPVVAPLRQGVFKEFIFAVYPRRGGRTPELGDPKVLEWIGRFLGRIHAVGAARPFKERETLTPKSFGHDQRAFLLAGNFVPAELLDAWKAVTEQALSSVDRCFSVAGSLRPIRLHGDCHVGNILWTPDGPHFVDLDDCVNGPAVQDLWLFLAGSRDEMAAQLGDLLEGYGQFCPFDYRELQLIEALRALRLMHYTAWITRRWHDPAFPRAFPWLGDARYWEEHVQALLEQRAALDEPPLAVLV